MSRLFLCTLGIMIVLSFSIVVVMGIVSGNSIPFVIQRGAIATLITGILWGLIGYLAFGEEDLPENLEIKKKEPELETFTEEQE